MGSGKLVTAQLLARARSDQISTACTLLKNPLLVHQYKVTTPFLLLQEFIEPTTPRSYHRPSSLFIVRSPFWFLVATVAVTISFRCGASTS